MVVDVSMEIAYIKEDGSLTYEGQNLLQSLAQAASINDLSDVTITSATTGQTLIYSGTAWVNGSSISPQSSVTASGQTSIDFTGIPSWVNRVTVMFSGLSTSGTSPVIIQLGDAGGIENTGYLGSVTSFNAAALTTSTASASIPVETGTIPVAAALRNGAVAIQRVSGNNYAATGSVGQSQTTANTFVSVDKALSAALTQVRITTAGGADTFDAGSVSISWE